MFINPVNVVRLLLASISAMYLMETPTIEAEIELPENIHKLLLDSIFYYNGFEVTEEISLDYEEPNQLQDFEIIEDDVEAWVEDNSNSQQCTNDHEDFDASYKRRAVEFWRYSNIEEKENTDDRKRHRSLKSVQHKFRRVSSERQLRRWEEQLQAGGTRTEKLSFISQFTYDKFNTAIQSGFTVHDIYIKRWALLAQTISGNLNPVFLASDSWVTRFKKSHRIVSRKITKFITRRTIEDFDNLQRASDMFVTTIQPLIEKVGPQQIYNSDQSGFQLEIHSGRSLSDKGVKKVERVVQSVSSTTHSYTIQPIIFCDGRLMSPLFIILKESSGTFGPIVQQQLFQPENVIVKASKSCKMTSGLFKLWLQEAFFPNVGSESVLIIDSWGGHCPDTISELASTVGKQVTTMIIPKGTTGKIQPLDVYGFRIWKNFAKKFSDTVVLLENDINLHQRNNIIKLQSLIHNQLSSPRYTNLFKYSWFKSGYTKERPQDFVNPVDFTFQGSSHICNVDGCDNIAIIRCSWCKKSLCLKHFFVEYHYCNVYNE